MNQLLDGTLLDPLSGTAVLNAVPVAVTCVSGGSLASKN